MNGLRSRLGRASPLIAILIIVLAFVLIAAALYFAATDQVLLGAALPMGIASIAGAIVGSRMALTRGVSLVRTLFLTVVGALVLKLAWDMLA